jgi:hypothetical protein
METRWVVVMRKDGQKSEWKKFVLTQTVKGNRGSVVVKALRYKPEGRRFETQWGEWIFSIYVILAAALGPGVYSASNRN